MNWLYLPTPMGEFRAAYSQKGLCRLQFPGSQQDSDTEMAAPIIYEQLETWGRRTRKALLDYFQGKPFAEDLLPPLDFGPATSFRLSVWRALLGIPFGRTMSYGDLAESLGKSGGARAVGAACGANPIPLIIPCHRVVAADGGLGGFSGGLEWKIRLLQHETDRIPQITKLAS